MSDLHEFGPKKEVENIARSNSSSRSELQGHAAPKKKVETIELLDDSSDDDEIEVLKVVVPSKAKVAPTPMTVTSLVGIVRGEKKRSFDATEGTAANAINLYDHGRDSAANISLRRGPNATVMQVGGSTKTAIELDSSDEEDSDSNTSRNNPAPQGNHAEPFEIDSSDDELTTLHERGMNMRQAPLTQSALRLQRQLAVEHQRASATKTTPKSTHLNSPHRSSPQKPPASLRQVPVMGRSARAMQPATQMPSLPERTERSPKKKSPKRPEVLRALNKGNASPDRRKNGRSVLAHAEMQRAQKQNDPHVGKSVFFSSPTGDTITGKPVAQDTNKETMEVKDAPSGPTAAAAVRPEAAAAGTEADDDDDDSDSSGEPPSHCSSDDDGVSISSGEPSSHCSTVPMDVDMEVTMDAFGDAAAEPFVLTQPPLDSTFDDDTVTSWRERRRGRGGANDVYRVRRPLNPTLSEVRSKAYTSHELDYSDSDSSDEESLPGRHDDKQDIECVPLMHFVEHLSTFPEPDPITGRPGAWSFTVHGGEDEILYDFVTNVKQSLIPGGGEGAFLTFKGARRLRTECHNKGQKIWDDHEGFMPDTMEPLQGQSTGGFGHSISLTGENLHGNNNKLYWRKSVKQAYDKAVKAGDTSNHDFVDKSGLPAVPNGIGFFGIHKKESYKQDNRPFDCPDMCFDLGRYGPFRTQDRKTENMLTVKSFIYSGACAEWPFLVGERFLGEPQMIDITGDETGVPHSLAKRNVPMYVNEVGHNPGLVQNVYISHHEQRTVRYFVRLQKPMEKGETVELLTNYGTGYEQVRERKGYGRRNLHQGLPGDEDCSCVLKRNFEDRQDLENVIELLSCPALVAMVEFVVETIWNPLQMRAKSQKDLLSVLQWAALRRMYWIRRVFLSRIKELEGTTVGLNGKGCYPYQASLDHCRSLLAGMEKTRSQLTISTHVEATIGAAVEKELKEELLYSMREKLLAPVGDSHVWCEMASGLIQSLSRHISIRLLRTKGTTLSKDDQVELQNHLLVTAKNTAVSLRSCLQTGQVAGFLSFTSGVTQGSSLSRPFKKLWATVKNSNSFFLDNTTTPKGFVAGVARKLAYLDALRLANIEPQPDTGEMQLEHAAAFVMVRYKGLSQDDERRDLAAIPVSMQSIGNKRAELNETWYLVWQVIYIIHAFATEVLVDTDTDYTLKLLCDEIGVDERIAAFAVARGMKGERHEKVRKRYSQKKESGSQPKSDGSGLTTARKKQRTKSKKAKKPKKEKKTTSNPMPKYKVGPSGRPPAKYLRTYNPPTDLRFGEWEKGWEQKVYERQSGETKGDTDSYWFTPVAKKKLRSMAQVGRYFAAKIVAEQRGLTDPFEIEKEAHKNS